MKTIKPGINWTWYKADSKEEAEEYYIEVTGGPPKYKDEIYSNLEDRDGKWSFRIHN